jgi:hypothetical protein
VAYLSVAGRVCTPERLSHLRGTAAYRLASWLWAWWDWVEDHYERLALLGFVALRIWTAGGWSVARTNPLKPTGIYLATGGTFVLGLWGIAGASILRKHFSVIPARSPEFTEASPSKERAWLRIVPYVANDGRSARAQIENTGADGTFRVDVHQIVGFDGEPRESPYSARWIPT